MQDSDGVKCPTDEAEKKLNALIDEKLLENKKVKITYSHMKSFFEDCHNFMCKYVLEIEEETNVADLTPPFLLGNLNHKILELFCKKLQSKNLSLKDNFDEPQKELLQQSIHESIEIFFASALTKELINSSFQNLENNMSKIVEEFSKIFSDYEIYAVEKSVSYYPENCDYFFYGKIDCILKNAETGEFVLIDFKSSKNAIPTKNLFADDKNAIPDFQMPIYIYILENQKNPIKIENCAFFDLSEKKLYPVTGNLVNAKSENNLEQTKERFLSLANFYANKVLSHDIDSEPAVEAWFDNYLRKSLS